jgi:hypothetical protein
LAGSNAGLSNTRRCIYDDAVKLRVSRQAGFVLAGLALLLVGGVAGYASAGGDTSASHFDAGGAAAAGYLHGTVQSFSGDTLNLTTDDGPVSLRISPNAPVEALRTIRPVDLAPGDWVNGGAARHQQTILALTALVAISQAQAQQGTGSR